MSKAGWCATTVAMAFCSVAGLSAVAAAGPQSPAREREWGGRGARDRGHRLAEYLGLDEQQRASIQKLRQQQRDEMKPLLEEGRDLRKKLREATEAEKPDALAVGEATLAVKAHHDKVKAQRAAFEQKLVALFTPEQKQKYDALKAARELGRGGARGPRRGRGFGPGGGPKGAL